ncbi:adrenodoxin, mitochondrial [Caerostris darwini]|uniref:Adrenodoxin, mitochondrial n=1 Tax=Caerostris darwini TaxID=1538125 RepID=A0AAV4RFE2_9ARAC|nr:adrenodoxin, mitochondrial [Caerostris darwini]
MTLLLTRNIFSRNTNLCVFYKCLKTFVPAKQTKTVLSWTNLNSFRYCNKSNQWVSVIFEKPDGTQIERNIEVGKRIYDAIQCNNPDFPGYGSCDGSAHCTTCHVILSKEDFYKYGEFSNSLIGEDEEDMIVCVTGHTATSRLGCCVKIVPEMDGMIVKLPEQVDSLIEKDD